MVAELLFAPDSEDADWDRTLSSLWGKPSAFRGVEDNGPRVVPKPCVYSTPSDFKVVPLCDNQAGAEQVLDGWQGPCPRAVSVLVKTSGSHPQTLGKLAVTKLFQERELTTGEQSAMATYSMKHASGELRLCSRPFWLRFYGLLNTPGAAALTESHPCAGMIVATTGLAAPAGLSSMMMVPCGRDRYCTSCEKFLALLSMCYGTCDVTDTLVALITRCVNLWSNSSASADPLAWSRSGDPNRLHSCGEHCPQRR